MNSKLAQALQSIHNALADIDDRLQNVEIELGNGYGSISNFLDEIQEVVNDLVPKKSE